MSRCKMIRVFGNDANRNHERCKCDTYYHDSEFCYLCTKYAAGLTTPSECVAEDGEKSDNEVVELYHMETKKTYYKKEV